MLQAVIFDMDGVLVDTEAFYEARRATFLRENGVEVEGLPDMTGSNEKAIWEAIVPDDAARREALKLRYRAYRKAHPAPYAALANPGTLPLLRALKQCGLRVAIASSSDIGAIHRMMEQLALGELVELAVSGEDCPRHKPAPDVYLKALGALGLTAAQAVAVEDSPAGIAAARAAGLKTFALRPAHGQLDQSAAEVRLESLSELMNYLG